MNAGVQLGAILEGPNPQHADVKDASGLSPRERVVALRKDFLRFYETNALVLERGISEIHAALVPGALQTSVLAAYGQVLMTKCFLNRVDSESLRGLYGDLAQTEALASWMASEYRSASPQAQKPQQCAGEAATIVGTTRRDKIEGTPGHDVIVALQGNDLIRGLGGSDVVCAGSGNDTVLGAAGQDRLFGGKGNDTLKGGRGHDILKGGPGRNRLEGVIRSDTALGRV